MSKIKYTFYDEINDTNSVVDLMKRNQFGLAKFDPNLTKEKFIDYQHKKGTLFAVVGKKDGEVISYVAAYQTGAQKVMHANQVYVGRLIIDKKYRLNLFSVKDMFGLVIKELVSRGYNDFICKIKKENLASFYMMRKLGFVILDEKRTLFDFYVLHNYLISAGKLFNRKDYINRDNLANSMQKLNKQHLYQTEKLIDGRFIHIDCKSSIRNYFLCIDTFSGNIAGIEFKDAKLKIWPKDASFQSYSFEDENKVRKNCVIELVDQNQKMTIKRMNHTHEIFNLSDSIDTMTLKIEGDVDTYTFQMDEMRSFSKLKEEMYKIQMGNFSFEKESGFLGFHSGFKEMWPHICAPYIEGILGPNVNKKLHIEKNERGLSVKEEKEAYTLFREYVVEKNKMEIKSKAIKQSDQKMQPMFQFALYDLSYDIKIDLEDGSSVHRIFDLTEKNKVNDEMIFVDFMQKEYSKKYVKSIEIQFLSNPLVSYRLSFEKAVRCFCQMNYLGIVYDEKVYKDQKEIDFGSITIEEINHSIHE